MHQPNLRTRRLQIGSLSVHGRRNFVRIVDRELELLLQTRSSKLLVRQVVEGEHPTVIVEATTNYALAENRSATWEEPSGQRGPGSAVKVGFKPEDLFLGDGGESTRVPIPRRVPLFHELIHARDMVRGIAVRGHTRRIPNVELATVGLPYREDGAPPGSRTIRPGPTENALREELGLPVRRSYLETPVNRRRR